MADQQHEQDHDDAVHQLDVQSKHCTLSPYTSCHLVASDHIDTIYSLSSPLPAVFLHTR